ncbi:TonB-dependent receptor [Pedobacter hiemivivus]|uniref:TonB-dependent receptor n=2 Tax=Pedobacter hiemivivus TaxID=2530454 RepID=A0A4U1G5A5_9SPHI|nr:TonB-dependent receptor [Pedobacter hiemivivus]
MNFYIQLRCKPRVYIFYKFLLIMKLTFVLLITAFLQISFAGYAQKVTVSGKNVPLEKIFKQIGNQTGYNFICDLDVLNNARSVDVHITNATIEEALEVCIKGQPISFIIQDKTIIIRRNLSNPAPVSKSIDISGKITDKRGQPLPGVTVAVKNSKIVSISGVDGRYKISVPDQNAILVFSSVGFTPQEKSVNNLSVINMILEEQQTGLNEIVVIGYATVNRKDLTGAVSSLAAKQIADIPVNSTAAALTGRLAGVNIVTTEGGPGAPAVIKIRGGGSITQDNSPLYVIDGIQVEDGLNNISPQDIESVNILKDASATAIYGARGANGVIIITTKGGKAMKTTVSLNTLFGINKVAGHLNVMQPYDFTVYQYEKTRNTFTDSINFEGTYGPNFASLDKYKDSRFVDWQKEVFGRAALMQTHNVSITGGNNITTFNFSYTNNGEQGVMNNSNFNRNILNSRFQTKISPAILASVNIRYNSQAIRGSGTSSSSSGQTNRLRHSVQYRPLLMGTNDINYFDQAYFDATNANYGQYLVNPLRLNDAEYRNNTMSVLNMNGFIDIKINKLLSFRTTGGVELNTINNDSYDGPITWTSIGSAAGTPIVGKSNGNQTSVNISNVLTFTNSKLKGQFNRDHVFTALVGQELYTISQNSVNNRVGYFPLEISPEQALAQLSLGRPLPLTPSSSAFRNKLLSFFGRFNYTYKDKYIATFTTRGDGSSKFGPDTRWGIFPSGALAWRISKEDFMSKYSFISDMKLRLSYGVAGNNRIADYLYQRIFSSNAAPYGLGEQVSAGYSVGNLANPYLKWETTESKNVGLDLSLFKNKLQVTIDAYQNDTHDLLVNVPIPSNSGYSTQLQNIAKTQNKGVELQISMPVVNNNNFSWDLNFNISHNRNVIKSLSNYQKYYYQNSGWGIGAALPDFIVQEGQQVGSMYGYVTDGFYKTSDFDYDPKTSIYTLKPGVVNDASVIGTVQPGSIKFKDLNSDGVVDNVNDRQTIGTANPKFFGGLNNQFTYKGFDLSIFLNFVYGNKILNANKLEFTNGFSTNTNLLDVMNSRWKTIDATGRVIQRVTNVGGKLVAVGQPPAVLDQVNANAQLWIPLQSVNAYIVHSWAAEDGSFLRVNNITMGYTFKTALIKKIGINSVRAYATVNNVAVITGYTGYDPEVSTRRATPVTPGVDYSGYPRSRTFILGLNANF